MENLGDIAVQALAGAVSTATHGTGLRFPNLSAQVHALRIVTASGDVVMASADGDDGDLFRAARVAIGSLGAISTVTLQVRADLHAAPHRRAAAARRRARRDRRLRRAPRALGVLHVPVHGRRVHAAVRAHRRAAAPRVEGRARCSRTSSPRTSCSARSAARASSRRAPSRGSTACCPGSPRARSASTAATASSPTSGSSASRRWSTRSRASTAPRRSAGSSA